LLIKIIMTPEIGRPAFPFSCLAGLFWDLVLMELWADFSVHCWSVWNWSICFIFSRSGIRVQYWWDYFSYDF
jgi:hypothetical protein